ncbi:MAG: radical SAM protein [Candidatus Alcyoniella australis]|nr:radical SAM protein [Candidatus Alcyoniella australis]
MRIACVNPPFIGRYSRSQRSPGVIKSGTMYYPYWLAHAVALLEQRGHQCLLLDAPASGLGLDATLELLDDWRPGLVVLDTSTPSFESDARIAAQLKGRLSGARVVLVGTHVSALPESCLAAASPVDGVAIGEYDLTIAELADVLAGDGDPLDVPGLAWRADDAIVRTAGRAPIEDLDQLPWIAPVYAAQLDPRDYRFSLSGFPMAMLISGRGCPNGCFFCVYPQTMHGRRYRARSPEHVVGEMEWIERNMPTVREIVFEDDTFTADESRVLAICELIRGRGLRLPWFANVRVTTGRETLRAMRDAGFRACAVGYESGSQQLLDEMHKGITLERSYRFAADAAELGVLVHGCFMVGFPGETEQTMQATLQHAIRLNPDSAQFYPLFPYPGTEAFAWAEQHQALTSTDTAQWVDGQGRHRAVLSLPGLSSQRMFEFCEQASRRFHFRPRYLAKKLLQLLTRPVEGLRSLRAGLSFVRYLLGSGRG